MLQTVNDYIDADLVHSIHTTERRSFRGCRRRWSWIFKDGYYPLLTPKPLEFGIAYHKAMETWYDPTMWGIDRDLAQTLAIEVLRRECDDQFEAYLEKTSQRLEDVDPEVVADYRERIDLGIGMLKEYAKISMQLDTNFKPIAVEQKFEVPITGPNGETIWCRCLRCWKRYVSYSDKYDQTLVPVASRPFGASYWQEWRGLPVTYGGRIDMLAEDLDGRYWIFDWKTAMRLSTGEPNAPDDFLFLDDQITSYCWALARVLNIDVAGFVYHEQKKAFPVEPEPLARPRLGCMYSKNKQMDCDWQTYEKTVRENDTYAYESGLYDDFIQYLKEFGGVFHKRHTINRTAEELRNAGLNIYYEACEITDPNLRIYPSPGRFGCTTCAYREPCLGTNRGDDVMYTLDTLFEKREKHYYQEPSTDKPDRG